MGSFISSILPNNMRKLRVQHLHSSDIKKTRFLVKGRYGKVYKGKCRGSDVAIKVPINQKLTRSDVESLQKELRIMSDLQHPNVCLFMGACLERNNIQLVTELMEGDISSLLQSKTEKTPVSTRIGWALEAAKGICWMHSRTPSIVHMDIKPDNILYDSQGRIKVCDFGLSEFSGKVLTRPVGSPLFMSPEMLQADKRKPATITEKTDVYSFGILLWEILTKKKAYSHHSMHGSFQVFRQAILIGGRPPIPSDCNPFLRHLLQSCWTSSPDERPTFQEIIEQLTQILTQYKTLELQQSIAADIDSPVACSFWFDAFNVETNVSWSEFSAALCQRLNGLDTGVSMLNDDSLQLKCLKEILLANYFETVSRRNFGRIIEWFGPMMFPYSDSGDHLLDRLIETMQLPYFHGFMDDQSAENILSRQNANNGSFLVRFACNNTKSLCISRVSHGESRLVEHLLISCNNGMFEYDSVEYSTVSDIVGALELGTDCTNNTYSHLFNHRKHIVNSHASRCNHKSQEDDLAFAWE